MSPPGCGSTSPASKNTDSNSVPFSLVRFHASERKAALICGGASEVAAAIETITDGKLADLAVEAIGKAETLNLAAKLLRRNGTLLAFGLPHRYNYDFAFHEFFWNEGRLICSLGPTVDDFRAAVDMISNGVIAVAPLVTHTFPLSRAQEAFTLVADRSDGVIKVFLTTEE